MPLRVKCRCGQELVLRFSEWVHAFFGLLVISLLVNGTALAYIAFKLGSLKSQEVRVEPAASEGASLAPAAAGDRSPPAPAPEQGPEPKPSPPQAPDPAVAAPEPVPPPQGSASAVPKAIAPLRAPADRPPGEDDPGQTPPAELTRLVRPLPKPLRLDLLPEGTTPLEKLLVVEKCDDLRLLLAFLSDGDEYVMRAALKKCLAAPAPAERPPHRDLLLVALPSAPGLLSLGGGDLLRRLAGEDHGPDPSSWWEWGRTALGIDAAQGPPGEVLIPLATRAMVLRESSVAAHAIEKSRRLERGKAASGTDVLVAIDSTESMEEPFSALARCGWIFLALAWSIPDLRAGLLLYDDEVKEGSLPLGTDPRDLARFLSGLKAEGGGDVPEGVYETLKASLQLGRFDWRAGAAKHIFFVGDGPPQRLELPALLSLAKECHQEGGFQIHAISVNPAEGRTATLFFPELAAAGGGRAVTAPNDRIANEIFLTLFPAEAREELSRLLPIGLPPPEGGAKGDRGPP